MYRALICVVALVTTACIIPTTSRTNARVSPGTTIGLFGGAQYVEPSSSHDGDEGNQGVSPYLEVDTQYGFQFGDNHRLAVQIKVPLAIPYTSVDVYYQFLDSPKYAMGIGVETSVLIPAIYAAFTRDLGDSLFVTFTPRVYWAGRRKRPVLNPQLSLGSLGPKEVTALLSVGHYLHGGENFATDAPLPGQDGFDVRSNYFLTGLSVRW
ncbi:MAG: hypothetical protein JKY56_21150 [Kofleriaceae bacterium]|nr:hypothetical protein [Kofleriaceae bacterium]